MPDDERNPTLPGPPDVIAEDHARPAPRQPIVRSLFNHTAQHYAKVNRLFSLGSGGWYRRYCLRRAGLAPGAQVIDIAVGTGLLAREPVAITGDSDSVIGVDVSEAMLAVARRHLRIGLVQGDAEALPLAGDVADFVTMGYALRHLADIDAALYEAWRVLRPGGTIVLLEISPPRRWVWRVVAAFYIGVIVPLLALLTTLDRRAGALMLYHWETIASRAAPETVMKAISTTGFRSVDCWTDLDLFRCYVGRKPDDAGAETALGS